MRINNNISALNAWRGLTNTDTSLSKSLEKLSSGLRINRAGDDAAGLAISEKMRGQIRGLNQASRNAQDAISLIQTAEGALNETHAILQRMRELAVQAGNDTLTEDDRKVIQDEVNELAIEIDRIAQTTQFNTKLLFDKDEAFDGKFLIGANKNQHIEFTLSAMDAETLNISGGDGAPAAVKGITYVNGVLDDYKGTGVTIAYNNSLDLDIGIKITTAGTAGSAAVADITINGNTVSVTADAFGTNPSFTLDASNFYSYFGDGESINIAASAALAQDHEALIQITGNKTPGGISVSDQDAANDAISVINDAILTVSEERSKLGATQNRLEHTIKNLGVAAENLAAAESRIRDVDMAAEMMNFTKQNILMQAGTAMLAQANARPQSVLQLLG